MELRQTVTNGGENRWVTDDEDGTESETDSRQEHPLAKQERSPTWWKLILQSLPRFRIRSERQWGVGERVLVMTGKPGLDEGQVAIVTEQKRCMVEVAFRGPDGTIRRKLKRSGTLIGVRPGVTLVQASDGAMWMQPEKRKQTRNRERNSQE
jgi:hypothetical protein